jgi:hypothetical protein
MADVKISALPAASTPLDGTELVPIVQGGVTEQVTVANLTAGRTIAAGTVNVDANTANAAVRITQTGSGNALLVEDSANPDATPFVINADGRLVAGHTSSILLQASTYLGEFLSSSVNYPLAAGYTGNSAVGPRFALAKNRSADWSTQTIVASGDTLGDVEFQGSDGTNTIVGARITAAVDGTPGTNDMPGRLVFATTADGASSPTERMRITSAGNVVAGGSVALATTATNGFLYVPTCAGAPTGTPTAITGMAPIVVDTTNNKLYFYSGGAWRDAGP